MIVDEIGAWKFAKMAYLLHLFGKPDYIAKRNAFNTTPNKHNFLEVVDHCFDKVYHSVYESWRGATRVVTLPNEAEFNKWMKAYNREQETPSEKWTPKIDGNNLRFNKIVSGDFLSKPCARISMQLDTDYFSDRTNNRLELFVRELCDILNAGGTRGINDINWKFTDKSSIGGRIDDVVIYVYGTVDLDQKVRVVGKFIAYWMKITFIAKKSKGIPGMVQCVSGVPGVYMASECSYPVKPWMTKTLSSSHVTSIPLQDESHGGSLGSSLGITLLECGFGITHGQATYAKVFKHYRS